MRAWSSFFARCPTHSVTTVRTSRGDSFTNVGRSSASARRDSTYASYDAGSRASASVSSATGRAGGSGISVVTRNATTLMPKIVGKAHKMRRIMYRSIGKRGFYTNRNVVSHRRDSGRAEGQGAAVDRRRPERRDARRASRPPRQDGRQSGGRSRERFAGPLEFGTAGLRGVLGAGPNRMNRAVVCARRAGLGSVPARDTSPDARVARRRHRLRRPPHEPRVRRGHRVRARRARASARTSSPTSCPTPLTRVRRDAPRRAPPA